jgi:MinD superfamily P-loop ATPase
LIASLAGADITLIAIEPTVSGFNDVKRVLTVARQFKTAPCVYINKFDLNRTSTSAIADYCAESMPIAGQIPNDRKVFDCMRRSMTSVVRGKQFKMQLYTIV